MYALPKRGQPWLRAAVPRPRRAPRRTSELGLSNLGAHTHTHMTLFQVLRPVLWELAIRAVASRLRSRGPCSPAAEDRVACRRTRSGCPAVTHWLALAGCETRDYIGDLVAGCCCCCCCARRSPPPALPWSRSTSCGVGRMALCWSAPWWPLCGAVWISRCLSSGLGRHPRQGRRMAEQARGAPGCSGLLDGGVLCVCRLCRGLQSHACRTRRLPCYVLRNSWEKLDREKPSRRCRQTNMID